MATVMNRFWMDTPTTIDVSVSTTASYNSVSVGPVTISGGITVTVATNTTWVVL
jgi:hypothetical protein